MFRVRQGMVCCGGGGGKCVSFRARKKEAVFLVWHRRLFYGIEIESHIFAGNCKVSPYIWNLFRDSKRSFASASVNNVGELLC